MRFAERRYENGARLLVKLERFGQPALSCDDLREMPQRVRHRGVRLAQALRFDRARTLVERGGFGELVSLRMNDAATVEQLRAAYVVLGRALLIERGLGESGPEHALTPAPKLVAEGVRGIGCGFDRRIDLSGPNRPEVSRRERLTGLLEPTQLVEGPPRLGPGSGEESVVSEFARPCDRALGCGERVLDMPRIELGRSLQDRGPHLAELGPTSVGRSSAARVRGVEAGVRTTELRCGIGRVL